MEALLKRMRRKENAEGWVVKKGSIEGRVIVKKTGDKMRVEVIRNDI